MKVHYEDSFCCNANLCELPAGSLFMLQSKYGESSGAIYCKSQPERDRLRTGPHLPHGEVRVFSLNSGLECWFAPYKFVIRVWIKEVTVSRNRQ